MNDVLNFFTEPYQSASSLHILLELIAAIFGVLSVFYAKKENILVFPTGIISTVLYVYLLVQWNLYGDLIINIYYTPVSYTHLRAHETDSYLVCRLLLEK